MCMVKVVDEKEIKTKIYGEMKSNDRRWKHVKCMNVLESSRGWEGKRRGGRSLVGKLCSFLGSREME